jgi:serine/threonine-protein kinase HipA
MKRGRAKSIIGEVCAAVARWPAFASTAHVADEWRSKISNAHRLTFPRK